MVAFRLNGQDVEADAPSGASLLSVLVHDLQVNGAKYGCGASLCGVCTVHLDGMPARACVTPVSMVAGRAVTTIEGLAEEELHPLQQAWILAPAWLYIRPAAGK